MITRDSKPSESGTRAHSDPMGVDALNQFCCVWQRKKAKGLQVHDTVASRTVETIFKESATLASSHANATTRKANTASHGPRVLAKEGAHKVREK